MALEDDKIVSREELVAKVREVMKLVEDQSDVLNVGNIDNFLNKSLKKIRVFSYRSYGETYSYKYWEGHNTSSYSIDASATTCIDRTYYIPEENQELFTMDFSPTALLNRFNTNPNDPLLIKFKDLTGVYINNDDVAIPIYDNRHFRRPRIIGYNHRYEIRFHASAGNGYAIEFRARPYSHNIRVDKYIPNPLGYTVLADYISNSDALAGGPSLKDFLLQNPIGGRSEHGDPLHIDRRYLSDNFDENMSSELSIDPNVLPNIDSVAEDSSMNAIFRAMLHLFANIRKISIQKQYRTDWGIRNIGGPIDIPTYVRNLKNISNVDVDNMFSNMNADEQLIDNKDIINKLNDVYNIWKSLPKTDIIVRYCHDSCHGSGRSRR
jgi:hypothetical protein